MRRPGLALNRGGDGRRLALLAGLLSVLTAGVAVAAPPTVWQLAPYRVQVLLAVAPLAELTPEWREALAADLAVRAEGVIGGPWQLSVAAAPASLADQMLAATDSLGAEAVPKESLEFDKVIWLAGGPGEHGYEGAARECDVRTRTGGVAVRREVRQTAGLRDAALRALLDAFAPLALVEEDQRGQATLRVRASALACRDRGLALTRAGDVLRPVIRRDQSDGSPARIDPVPGTVLKIEAVAPDWSKARVESVQAVSLPGAKDRGIESLALGLAPSSVRPGPAAAPPDDLKRLEAEAVLSGLRDELVDTVTLRAVLLAQGAEHLKAKRSAEAKAALAELEKLQSREQFLESLAAAKKKLGAGDPAAQARIDALVAETERLIREHLDPRAVEEFAAGLKSAGVK